MSSSFSLSLGLSIGLLASFIQSLGLTIQRKSHLQNEALPLSLRKPDYARPAWLFGFSIYFFFNILGSIFQIGTLPLIILAPLGAVSLLWNAILARFLLGDHFSIHLIFGTLFIAIGALLIGLFGLLPDQSNQHTLNQLIYLYFRTPFLIHVFILVFIFSIICFFAHWFEFKLHQSTSLPTPTTPSSNQQLSPLLNHQPQSSHTSTYQSTLHPSLLKKSPHHCPSYRPRSTSSPTHLHSTHPLSLPFAKRRSVDLFDSHIPLTPTFSLQHNQSPPSSKPYASNNHHTQRVIAHKNNQVSIPHQLYSTQRKIDQLKLLIGVAYGSTSGTLSGICLLFAKTGVELLIRTLSGIENEFVKIQTWLILLVLLLSALLQLWYLNKALRLVNPTLICPLAFCFYNLSSIISSLVYYDQIKLLSTSQVVAISMGTTVLLGGVWIVSNGTNNTPSNSIVKEIKEDGEDAEESMLFEDEVTPLLRASSRIDDLEDLEEEDENDDNDNNHDGENQVMLSEEPTGMDEPFDHDQHDDSSRLNNTALDRIHDCHRPRHSLQLDPRPSTSSNSHPFDRLIRQFLVDGHVTPVRGFSFGLGAASPGFAIRPKRRNNWISEPLNRSTNRSFSFNSYPIRRYHNLQQQEQQQQQSNNTTSSLTATSTLTG